MKNVYLRGGFTWKMAFFATIVTTLILDKTITNYISLESSWPVDYKNVYFNVLVIIVTWHQAFKVPHAVHDPCVLEKRFSCVI